MATVTSSLILSLIDRVTAPARTVTQTVDRLNGRIVENNRRMRAMSGAMVGAAATGYALARAISSPVSAALELEGAMADVRKVVDFDTPEDLVAFKDALMEMSEIPGMPAATDLAAIAAAAGQAGIERDKLLEFTEAAARVGTAFDVSADMAGESLAKLMTGLGLTVDEAVLLSDSMNHLSNSQAATAAQILDVVKRVGASGKQFGFAAQEVSAFASAMIAAGAAPEVAATSFRNMGRALTKGESATKRQGLAMKRLGFDSVEIAREMQEDAVGTTLKVIEALGQLPKEVQAAVSSDLFGDEARALGPLLTNTDLLRESLNLVSDESKYAGSSFAEFENRANTFGAELAAFRNTVRNLGIVIGETLLPPLVAMVEHLKPIVDAVADWARAHPELVAGIVQATAAVVAFRVSLIGLRFLGLAGMGLALRGLATGMNTVGRAAAGIGGAAAESVRLNKALAGMSGAKVSRMSNLGAALRGIAGVTGLRAVGAGMASFLGVLFSPAGAAAAAIIGAIAAAGIAIYKNWDGVKAILSGVGSAIAEELQPALDLVQPALDIAAPAVQALGDAMAWVGEKVGGIGAAIASVFTGDLFARNIYSDAEKASLEQGAKEITRMIIDAVNAIPAMMLDIGKTAIKQLLEGLKSGGAAVTNYLRSLIRDMLPGWLGGGGEDEGDESKRALGGSFGRGPLIVGENGPEGIYPSRAGFVAHHQQMQRLAELSRKVTGPVRQAMIPQPSMLPIPVTRPAPRPAANVQFGDIIVQGGANASAEDLAREFGAQIEARLRSQHSDYD